MNGLQLHFGQADGTHVQTSNLPLRKVGFDLYFWVNDVKVLFEELSAKDVEIEEPLVMRVYGNQGFAIKDCNGFKIMFGEQ